MSMNVVCPTCGKELRLGSKFCGGCGSKIDAVAPVVPTPASSVVCPACGKALKPGAKFCGFCGTVIGAKEEPAVEEVIEPVPEPVAEVAPVEKPAEELCPTCGKTLKPSAKFCGFCGTVIGAKEEPAVEEVVEPIPEPVVVVAPIEEVVPVEEPEEELCPTCGKALKPGAKFCGFCGTVIGAKEEPAVEAVVEPVPEPVAEVAPVEEPAENLCPTCGKALKPGAKFCGFCGTVIGAKEEPVVEEVVEPVPEPVVEVAPVEKPAEELCPTCGKALKPGAKFCGFCGAIIESKEAAIKSTVVINTSSDVKKPTEDVKMIKCAHCGKMINAGSKFCGYCATVVAAKPAPKITYHSDFHTPDSL